MEPITGPNNDGGISDIIVAIFTLFFVIGLIMFAAKMIFRSDGVPAVTVEEDEEKEDD